MDTAITVLQALLTLFFTSAGLSKLVLPYARYTNLPGQGWSKDFEPGHVRLIGVLELAAAAGMVVSLFSQSPTMLTPLVAVAMALVMSGAMATHLRRSEYVQMFGNLAWLGVALFVAYGNLFRSDLS